MWHVLHLIARPFEALLGVFCIVTAVMLYPDEEGKIQSKFEDFWVRVDDFQSLALTRHAAFMTQVAKLETYFLDRVFGHKLISARAIGASLFCTIAPLLLMVSFVIVLELLDSIVDRHELVWFAGYAVAAICVGLATFGRELSQIARIVLSVACFASLGFTIAIDSDGSRDIGLSTLFASSILFGGFAGDVAFIVVTRKLFRWAGEMTSFWKVLVAVIFSLLSALFLVGPAIVNMFRAVYLDAPNTFLNTLVTLIGFVNLFDTLLAILFVSLSTLLLIHRLIWPLLTRTLFRMTDIGTKGRRAILTTVGLALLAAGISGKVPELVQKIIEKLGG
jgi:hypothetical protein